MTIKKAARSDIGRIMEIYHTAQDYMIEHGNPGQWGKTYPSAEIIEEDIALGRCFTVVSEGKIAAVFALMTDPDPTYRIIENGNWLNDDPYLTIHRVASDGTAHGIVKAITDHCKKISENIRIDTHDNNLTMQNALIKCGFVPCGRIYLADGSPRIAFQWTNRT